VLEPLSPGAALKTGDQLVVRILLRSDRDLEFVQLKDMRASCLEPADVLSEYHWQGGLGYYESTRDASTQFFIEWLPRGSYSFDYPLVVTQTGHFSNGICTAQCLYAPEFSSHSAGMEINVE
jgi:Bacterial Alpha-2-macroglobulin MG10 domain